MAFKMKGMNYGEGTGSALPLTSLAAGVGKLISKAANYYKKSNKSDSASTTTKKTNVYKPKPVQTVSRKEYIPQSQRKSGNTGVSYSQAYASKKDDKKFIKKYPTEKSFTKAAKEYNKKNVKKEYDPKKRKSGYIPQSQRK